MKKHSQRLLSIVTLATLLTNVSPTYAEHPVFSPVPASTVYFGNAFLGYGYSVVTSADMNGDGNLDIVMSRPGSHSVEILRGNGDGTFDDPAAIPVGGHPVSVVTADFDEDGKPDFACTNGDLGTVTIFLSLPSGDFVAGGSMVTGSRPVRLVAADMNEDGHQDLLVVDQIDSTVGLLVGDGAGGFGALQVSFVEIDDSLEAITVDDLDGDGHLDLIIPCPLQDLIAVVLGLGNGTFLPALLYAAGDDPGFVAVSDYDGDGNKDVAANNRAGDSLSILKGIGFGLLAPYEEIPIGDHPSLVRSLDTGGTGEQDLVISIAGDNQLRILWGLGASSDGFAATINLSYSPDLLITGDFDGDALEDVVVVDKGEGAPHGTVQLYLNQTIAPAFRRGDVDRDALLDLDDAVEILAILFQGAPHECADSSDFDDNGSIDIADAITLLAQLYQPIPPAPSPLDCNVDTTADLLPPCVATCP